MGFRLNNFLFEMTFHLPFIYLILYQNGFSFRQNFKMEIQYNQNNFSNPVGRA